MENGVPAPYHIATGMRLRTDVKADTVLAQDMIEGLETSPLWQLRVEQDNAPD